MATGVAALPAIVQGYVNTAASQFGIPPNLLAGVIMQESSGNVNVPTGSSGDTGLAQVLPGTAAQVNQTYGTNYNIANPQDNVLLGAGYLAQQLNRYGGNVDQAISAYNAGSYTTANNTYVAKVLNYAGVDPGANILPSGGSSAVAVGQQLGTNGATSGTGGATAAAPSTGIGWLNATLGAVGSFVNEGLLVSLGIGLVLVAMIFIFMGAKTKSVPLSVLKGLPA